MKNALSVIAIFAVLVLALTFVVGIMDFDIDNLFEKDSPPGTDTGDVTEPSDTDQTDPPTGSDETDPPSGGDETDPPSGGDETDPPVYEKCDFCGSNVTEDSPYFYGTEINGPEVYYFCGEACYQDYIIDNNIPDGSDPDDGRVGSCWYCDLPVYVTTNCCDSAGTTYFYCCEEHYPSFCENHHPYLGDTCSECRDPGHGDEDGCDYPGCTNYYYSCSEYGNGSDTVYYCEEHASAFEVCWEHAWYGWDNDVCPGCGVTLSAGTYVFKDDINYYCEDDSGNLLEVVNLDFISNGDSFSSIKWYDTTEHGLSYDDDRVYMAAWDFDGYRTIVLETAQIVPEVFYNWILDNSDFSSGSDSNTYTISGIWKQTSTGSLNSNEQWGEQAINGTFGTSEMASFDTIEYGTGDNGWYEFYLAGSYAGGFPVDHLTEFYIDFGTSKQTVSVEFYRAIENHFTRVDNIGGEPDDDIPVIYRECDHCGNSVTENSPYYYGTEIDGQGDELFYFCSLACYDDYIGYITPDYEICDHCNTIVTESSPYFHGTEIDGHGGEVFYFCSQSCYNIYTSGSSGDSGNSGGVTPGESTLSGTYKLNGLGSGYEFLADRHEYITGTVNGETFLEVGYSSGDEYIEFYNDAGSMVIYIPISSIDFVVEDGFTVHFDETQTPTAEFLSWFLSAFVRYYPATEV